jgi:GNAT superfamily N-acetyltransferase
MSRSLPQGYGVRTPDNDQEWEAYYSLRWTVLRKPWNQPEGSEKDEQEDSCIHSIITNAANKIVAAGRLQMNDAVTAQIRYMAVDPSEQGKGLGAAIIDHLERVAISKGATLVFLQARENAVPFYLACGYEITEKTFLLYGTIQHFRMDKRLSI